MKKKTTVAGHKSRKRTYSAFDTAIQTLLEHLDTLNKTERVERIDDVIHRMNFERRLTLLTDNQRKHMEGNGMSEAVRAQLHELKGTPKFEHKIEEFARSLYFRQCAWVDYLNNGGEPPIPPNAGGNNEVAG